MRIATRGPEAARGATRVTSSCLNGFQHSGPTLPRVSVSSAASQQHKYHVDTCFCGTAEGKCPRPEPFTAEPQCGWPNPWVLDHCPRSVRYFLCGRYCRSGSVPDRNVFCRVAVWGSEDRTHAVAGNARSPWWEVDTVASLRVARVGCLFQNMLLFSRRSKTYNASGFPRRLEFPETMWTFR